MDTIREFFSNLFDYGLWPPRWHCGYWSDFHGWLYILSDTAIWAAYFTIPVIILKYVSKKNVRFHKAYIYFAAFILACGFTHLLDATMFWFPVYRFNALVRFITAIISWLTVYHLIKMLPVAFTLKTPDQLEDEVERSSTLLKKLEQSNAELKKQKEFIENIFNATLDHMNVFDIELNLISLNAQTEQLLNKRRNELLGRNFLEVFPDSANTAYHEYLKAASKGHTIKNKITQDEKNRHYDTSFIPLHENNEQYATLVISKEITESIEKELTLEKLNSDLNEQNEKLIKANAELESFTYILSHDLQEPLRKIQSYYGLIVENENSGSDKLYLDKISYSATRMKTLIRDVLDYSRSDKVGEAFEPVRLQEVFKDVVSDLELYIQEKKASVTALDLPEIKGVRYQMEQVFQNLIVNAIKYNKNEPRVELSFQTIVRTEAGEDKTYFKIRFKDNGIGFDEQFKNEIFFPFKRLQNKGDYEGTGIGLALVKRVIEAHKGFIEAESVIGKGSVFTLFLPAFS